MTSKRVTVKSPILYKSVDGNVGLKIQGKTEQNAYTGKNLFSMRKSDISQNGIAVTVDVENQSFSASGTATANASISITDNYDEIKGKIANGGTFTISLVNATFDSAKCNISLAYGYNGTTYWIKANGESVTVPNGSTMYSIGLYVPSGTTINLSNVKVQLEESDVVTEWEPYVGGKPSPSPSYPQEIKSVVLNTIKTRTKNFFPFPNVYYNGTGLTLAKNTDGTYSLNGSVTGNEIRFLGSYANTDKVITLKNGNYKCVATINDKVINSEVTLTNGTTVKGYSGDNIAITDEWAISSLKVTVTSDVSSYSNAILKIMICDYNASDNFEPYQSSEITLSEPIELNGFNGVYDVVTSDGVTRRFGVAVLDGTESYRMYNKCIACNVIDTLVKPADSNYTIPRILCEKFIPDTPSNVLNGVNVNTITVAIVKDTFRLRFHSDIFSSVEDAISYFSTNPTSIVYELATPTMETIDLSSLKTFNGTTYIETDCEIVPTIYADYLREVNIVGKICLGDKEASALAFGDKKAILACLGDKEVWIDVAPECVAFSADVSVTDGYSYVSGFSESNRFVDDTLLSEVVAPVNNIIWCKTDTTQSNTVTKKAYVPSAKALKKYKYAVVTVKSSIAYHNGTNTGIFGNITLPKLTADNTIVYNTNTYKVELNDNTNIQSICNCNKGQTNWATACNIAIEKIVLTNSEE